MSTSPLPRRPAAPQRPSRVAALLVAVVLALLAASCSSSGGDKASAPDAKADSSSAVAKAPDTGSTDTGSTDTGSTDTAATDDTSGTAGVPAPKLDWEDCRGDLECATVELPLDYGEPDGKTIEIGVARRPATDQDHKIGPLFINPGGPGVSAIDFLSGFGFSGDIADRFDIVAVDPRGVGASSQIDCNAAPAELYEPDPTIEDQADRDTYVGVSQDYADQCEKLNGALLEHVGTRDTARDMDQIRRGLGADKLNYLGFSYGTALGETYADLFPTKIRAMVLDGVVDLSVDGTTGAVNQAKGFQLAFDHFLADCKAQGSACPMGADPDAVLASVTKKAEAAPIPSATADRPAGPGELSLGIGDALYSEARWPDLARALAEADKGDGSGLVDLADDYLDVTSGTEKSTSFDGYFAIGCVDQDFPRDPDAVLASAKAARTDAPDFGEAFVNDYVRCAVWPAKADPLTAPKAVGSPPILVVGTTGDPATPYESSVKVAAQLPKGRLLTYDGEGHTAYGTSSCVTDHTDEYLLELKLPPKGTICKE